MIIKLVYRDKNNNEYWDSRWENELDAIAENYNENMYPIKYANIVCKPNQKILEIGVGGGRVFNYLRIIRQLVVYGIESSKLATDKIIEKYSCEQYLRHENCTNMSFEENTFDVILAFGVFHNFDSQDKIAEALQETKRVAKNGAEYCISLRPDNFSANLNEWLWKKQNGYCSKKFEHFHKMLISKTEAVKLLEENGFEVTKVVYDQNYPILRKFKIFRKDTLSPRTTGYKLNFLGNFFNKILCVLFPYNMSNIMIFTGNIKKIS